tara:strand:- start:121 stop:705 length:585 start_codon:yes stop_codon:yes gene_type:complete
MYRYLNIPFFIKEPNKELNYIKIDNSNSGYIMRDVDLSEYNKVKEWIDNNYGDKISLGYVTQLYTSEKSVMTIHSDLEHQNNFAKLNFNFADDTSSLQFFEVEDKSKIQYKQYKQNDELKFEELVPIIDEKNAKFICEAKDNSYPTLVNAGSFHRANNKLSNIPRYVVSFSLLNKDGSYLTFESACDILSECII